MAGLRGNVFVCTSFLFLSVHGLTPRAAADFVKELSHDQSIEQSGKTGILSPPAEAAVQRSSLMRKEQVKDPRNSRRHSLLSIDHAGTLTSVAVSLEDTNEDKVNATDNNPEETNGDQVNATDDDEDPDGEGKDLTLEGLDANTAETRAEEESVLKLESLASVLMAEETGESKEKAMQMTDDLIDGRVGADTWKEIVDTIDSIPEEAVETLENFSLAPTAEDLLHLERLEFKNRSIQSLEDSDHEPEREANESLLNVEDTSRTLLTRRKLTLWPKESNKIHVKYCRGSGLTNQAWGEFGKAVSRVVEQCEQFAFEEVADDWGTHGSTCKLKVKGNEEGCWAHVGYLDGRNQLNLHDGNFFMDAFTGTCATTGIAEHELLHTLGMWHEQSRPDRDGSMTVYENNIGEGKKHNFDKAPDGNIQQSYDLGSLMHYGCKSFSTSMFTDTLRAHRRRRMFDGVVGRADCWTMGQRTGMSTADADQLRSMYTCETRRRSPQSESRRRRRRWW